MTFEELQRANEATIPTNIGKAKDYVEVNQRVKAFRMLFPNGAIETDILSIENGVCIIKATVKDEQGNVLSNGTAYEKEGSTFINKTSYIENCETSAVGRALAFCGIGVDMSIASKEEVENAKLNQGNDNNEVVPEVVSEEQIKALKKELKRTNTPMLKILNVCGIKDIKHIKPAQYTACMNKMAALPDYKEEENNGENSNKN